MVEKAKSYLSSAENNKASEEVSSLKIRMESLVESIEKKDRQIADLLERLDDAPKKRGRPRKEE